MIPFQYNSYYDYEKNQEISGTKIVFQKLCAGRVFEDAALHSAKTPWFKYERQTSN
jgi:hypothetical protein